MEVIARVAYSEPYQGFLGREEDTEVVGHSFLLMGAGGRAAY